MKTASIILSIIFFTLACIPCIDGENTGQKYGAKLVAENHSGQSDKANNDICSPFCICNCCSGVTLYFLSSISYDFPVQFEEIKSSNPIYTSALHSNFYGSIWQPPQIV